MNNRTSLMILLVVAVALLFGSVFVVDQRQYALKFQLGKIIRTDYEPGLYFKIPFVNNVRKFDKRILTLDQQPEQMNTKEQKYVDVDYFVKWRIIDVANFYTATQGNESLAVSRLVKIFSDGIRDEFAQRTLREVVSEQRAEIMDDLTATAGLRVADLGIEIIDVRIKQISLTDRVTDSVFNRMATQRTEFANELRSLGRERSELIRSNADRQVRVLMAEAQRDAEQVRGEGDARSANIYASAYNQDREFYSFNRSLEAYRKAFGNNQDIMVLDPGSEFFDYFNTDSGSANQ